MALIFFRSVALDKQYECSKMKRVGVKRRSSKSHRAVSTKLRTAAEVLLRHEGKSVMDGLAENCRDGQVQSAKLLYELAQGTGESGDFRSLAFSSDKD